MNLEWVDIALSLGLGIGLAAAAGLRVFVPLLLLGLAARGGWVPVADQFGWISTDLGLAALAAATVLEVSAYYIPFVDNALDAVAAPMAIAAGIILTAAVTVDMPPAVRWSAAIIAGGGTAATVHGLTSAARLKSSAFTAGFANPVLSTLELLGSIATTIAVIAAPVIALGIVAILFLIIRGVRRRLVRRVAPAVVASS